MPGAQYQNDFIELHNSTGGTIIIDVDNKWSVQYTSAIGSAWQVVTLPNGTIQSGEYYLIKLGPTGINGVSLPPDDLSNALDINPIDGKIALVKSHTSLSNGCPPITSFVDFIGYGAANCSEDGPAPAGSNSTALVRLNNQCRDFENNSNDFIALSPTPRNSSSPQNVCIEGWRTDYFKETCTDDATIVHPILSAERLDLQGDGDFTGDWIRDNAQRNMFEAERLYYQGFVADDNGTSDENVITPGAVMWFAQSFMLNHMVNPILFTTNSPVCANGGFGTLNFEYRGPIEQGISYTFTVSGTPGCSSTGIIQPYSGTGFALNLPSCSRATGIYTATLDLDYGCGTYSYTIPVKVGSAPTVEILTQNTSTMCEGQPVLLQATNGSSYLWNTGAITQQITVTNSGNYSCTVTGGNCSGTAAVNVNMLSNPDFTINTSCPGNVLALTLSPFTTGTISWNTNQTTQSINVSSPANYISTVTQANDCFRQHEIPISGIPITQPTVSPTGPFTYCQGLGTNQTLQLSNPSGTYSGVTYLWSQGSTTTSISNINPNVNTNYKIRVNKYGCFNESNPVVFTVYPLPTASFASTSVCSGNSLIVNLTGSAPFSVTYSDGTNHTINSSTNQLTLSNPAVGTYSLISVTDANNCSSNIVGQSAVVNVNPTVTVNSIQGETCPGLQNGSAIALPNPSAGTYQYGWSCTSATTSAVTGLAPGSCNVFVTNTANSCSSSSVSFTVPSANPICSGTKQTCVAPINVSSYFPGGWIGTSSNRLTVAIHNDFYIDNNFTIQFADVKIDPNVRIFVNQNRTLNISNSTLKKCTSPWYGIVLNTGSVLNVTSNSEIDDAIVAVDAPGGSTINLRNSSFFRNDVTAYIHNGDFINKISIYGNLFDFQNLDLRDPTATHHINVQQATNVLIGDPAQTRNYFTHASIAININTSNTIIKNNEFYNLGQMIFTDALQWITVGQAILATGTGSPYFHSIIGGIPGTNEINIFHHIECDGIMAQDNVDVNINGNNFYEIKSGIVLYNMVSRQIDIKENSFRNFSMGIYGSELPGSILKIYLNRFNMISWNPDPTLSQPELYSNLTRYGSLAISIQNERQNSLYYDCHNNWIANCVKGIHSRNLYATTLTDVITQHNQIFYTHPGNEPHGIEKGIWLENCNKNQISNNHIKSTTTTPPPNLALSVTGIRFDFSPDNLIKENFISRMGYGMYASYDCNHTELHCNNIRDYTDGIKCFKLTLSEQGDASINLSWKNVWEGTMTGSYRITGNPAVPIRWNYQNGFEAPFPFLININPNLVGNGDPDCTIPDETSREEREKYFEEVAFESATYNSDPLFHEYYAKLLFYSGLNKDTTLLHLGTPDDTIYQQMFYDLKNSNVGQFEAIIKLIQSGDLQAASVLLNPLIDDNITEQYKKAVIEIYLDCKINGHRPNSVQRAILEPIAYQLGIYGGEATYMARALLNIFVDEDLSTARIREPQFYTHGKKKVEQNVQFKFNYIYPNPANNELNFLLPENITSNNLQISDCYGSLIQWIKWDGSNKELRINTENYNAGVYFVTLFINNEAIQTDRVVIIH